MDLTKNVPVDQRHKIDRYNCYHRILPSESQEYFDSFIRLKQLFDKMVGKKDGNMSLTGFSKLAKIKPLAKVIPKPSIEILYKRIVKNAGVGSMDLEHFFEALEELAQHVFGGQMSSIDLLIDLIEENQKDLITANVSFRYAKKVLW